MEIYFFSFLAGNGGRNGKVNAGGERISIVKYFCGLLFHEVDGDACCLLKAPTYLLFIEYIAMILKIVIAAW